MHLKESEAIFSQQRQQQYVDFLYLNVPKVHGHCIYQLLYIEPKLDLPYPHLSTNIKVLILSKGKIFLLLLYLHQ